MKIALAGNPNSGKTTLFNIITGKTEYVGNWPGVTVEKKVANLRRRFKVNNLKGCCNAIDNKNRYHKNLKGCKKVSVVDLPGAYSISPFTSEEAITRDFILDENPDIIINVIDSSSLERSLLFTTQLLELDIPIIIALNKYDVIKQNGDVINIKGLSEVLQTEIVEIIASEGCGVDELFSRVFKILNKKVKREISFELKGTKDEDKGRQLYIKDIFSKYYIRKRNPHDVTFSDKVDRILANAYLGIPIFILIMWAVYALSISGLGGFASSYINDTLFGEVVPNAMNNFFEGIDVHPLLQSLIVEGAIGGVGAVLGFLPLIMVLFFCLALLEDSGYMSRVAVIMDRFFKRIGLSGKSVIPIIVGSGCSIPGIMATRTIEDDRERIATVILTPFMPCGAKLPIIALMSAVFFPGSTFILPVMYVIAGIIIVLGGLLLKKIFKFESSSAFIIELPRYKLPSLKHAIRQVLFQSKAFILKAATIILVMNTIVWFMQNYSWSLKAVDNPETSILASFGSLITPLLIPLGFIGWQIAASLLTGFIAKENVVATFAIILAASDQTLYSPDGSLSELFTPVTALAFLVFVLFTPPCFAAIGAMNAELHGFKWLFKALIFQFGIGYTMAMLINQVGNIIVYGKFAQGFLPAILILILGIIYIYYLINFTKHKNKGKINYSSTS